MMLYKKLQRDWQLQFFWSHSIFMVLANYSIYSSFFYMWILGKSILYKHVYLLFKILILFAQLHGRNLVDEGNFCHHFASYSYPTLKRLLVDTCITINPRYARMATLGIIVWHDAHPTRFCKTIITSVQIYTYTI